MSESESALPHWDMSVVYPGIASAEFEAGFRSAVRAVEQLVALFDQCGIERQEPIPIDSATVCTFETVIDRYNTVLAEVGTLRRYIQCFVDADSRNELAQTRLGAFKHQTRPLSMLEARFDAWVASLDVATLHERSAVARAHAFFLHRAKQRSAHLMSPAEEAVAREMSLTGSAAWKSLCSTLTSQLTVALETDGKTRELSISGVRTLMRDPDRAVRRRAYEAEIAAWERVAVPLVAALNAIKGEQSMLARRRGWASPLDAALFENSIDRQTLDALMAAVHDAFPDFRRYLKARARALGLPVLAWYDLDAPLGESKRVWSFPEARQFIVEQFGAYSNRLGGLAERAFQERWIDAEPRPGKIGVNSGYHLRDDESRILVHYKPTFYAVNVLAHELGHAYHNLNLARRTPLQRRAPGTLAETASTFCQTLVSQAGLQQADAHEQIVLLDASLQMATLLVVTTATLFLFEKAFYEKRQHGELFLETLKQMMLEAQRQAYGDALDPNALHPYTFMALPSLYSYWNFQYSFGLLLALGLYGCHRNGAADFQVRYDELLSATGMEAPADLAARFGIDIRSPSFWRSGLDVIRADIERFESAVDAPRRKQEQAVAWMTKV